MSSGISANDADKSPITFDTESTQYEEMKAIAAGIQSAIPDDSPLFAFKNRFNEVYNFFVSMYQKNQALLQKAQEGNAQIILNANKTATILKIVEKDAKKLEKFKNEYEETVGVVKSLNASEIKSRELLQVLSKTISTLNGQIQRGEAFCYGEEDTIASIMQDVRNLTRERNEAAEEIDSTLADIKKKKETIKYMNDQTGIMTNNSLELETQIEDYQGQLDKLNAEVEAAREGINQVRPIVEGQKAKNVSNLQLLREHEALHKDLMKQNNEIGKLLIDSISKQKQLRYQNSQHTKLHNKLVRHNATLKDHFDHTMRQYEQSVSEYLNCKNELETTIVQIQSNTEMLNLISANFDSIESKKRETRFKSKSLREDLSKLNHTEVMQGNERSRTVRQMHSTTHSIGVVQSQFDESKIETANVLAITADLVQEKRTQKKRMQEEKIKLRQYEKEIETKEFERMQVDAQKQLVDDDKSLNLKKISDDNQALDELTVKNRKQSDLAEQLRNERNTFKRKYLAMAKECEDLSKLYGDICTEVDELRLKNRAISIRTADEHYAVKCIQQRLMIQQSDSVELREKVYQANHSITGLEAERQLLMHILNEAASDRLLLQKELATAIGSRKAITGILVERRRTIDDLKGNILTLLQHTDRGIKDYNTKLGEIDRLMADMNVLAAKNQELERRRERLKFSEHEERRIFNLVNQETQKCAALIREISLPRNVHRWQMYLATDPLYQRNLMYMAKIYGRIDYAHRYLIHLEAKRTVMKKQLEEMKKKVIPNGDQETVAFQHHIGKYKRDIDVKDRMICEMKEEISQNRILIKNIENGVDTMRDKYNDRRVSISQLRSRDLASKCEKRQTLLYLTEPTTTRPLGGGFVQRLPPQSTTLNATVTADNGLSVDSSSPRKKTPKTPKTPKGCNGKRILRPTTAIGNTSKTTGNRKRPNTALSALS